MGAKRIFLDKRGRDLFQLIKGRGRAKTFSEKKIYGFSGSGLSTGGEDFFTTNYENPRFHFSKKPFFKIKKINVGSNDSSVFIGV